MTIPTKKTRLFTRRDVDRVDFVDKLAQRWLVERSAVTMYDAAIPRLQANELLRDLVPELERFRKQEELHATMLAQLLGELGYEDPHRAPATPQVNLAASAMAAILESVRSPTATARSILEAMLMAEHMDIVGWELLTDLAKEAQLDDDYVRSFRAAGREEAEHQHVLHAHVMRLEREVLLHEQIPGMMPHT
jgi:ferritin-like metal-binding protein YciE